MGEELKIIYRILKSLRASMDAEEFDVRLISNETLGISKPKWSRLIAMLVSDGYIDGVSVTAIDNMPLPLVELVNPCITLKGLEYLEENSLMKRAAEVAKGIAEIIP